MNSLIFTRAGSIPVVKHSLAGAGTEDGCQWVGAARTRNYRYKNKQIAG
jgi:hypothetical protein